MIDERSRLSKIEIDGGVTLRMRNDNTDAAPMYW